jgi:hypothetical protein
MGYPCSAKDRLDTGRTDARWWSRHFASWIKRGPTRSRKMSTEPTIVIPAMAPLESVVAEAVETARLIYLKLLLAVDEEAVVVIKVPVFWACARARLGISSGKRVLSSEVSGPVFVF